ncbi:PHO85 cyclin-7 [Tolypocladium capitatum]|uniref:PHO85 cyclin-7 n=1 Tax=Tolypocladium capitatum TaxID=45235 RepID=A0A2K3QCF3_9HYPO|nr:PHO85 cyclin-7 [Tolypocladium capitatum]
MASPQQPSAVDASKVPEIQQQKQDQDPGSGAHDLPPTPVPSSDSHLGALDDDVSPLTPDEHDLFKLPALDALKLLSGGIELLVRMTGDVPPTPPPRTPTDLQMSDMQAEKENIVRSHSEKSLARMRLQAERKAGEAIRDMAVDRGRPQHNQRGLDKLQAYSASMSAQLRVQAQHQHQQGMSSLAQEIDGVHLRQRSPSASPSAPSAAEPQPYIIVGADSQPLNLQHGAITRKFYSKREPPISINQYLLRLHQFCPMSTAVYLATSLYIHRLAVEERVIPVTCRNAHRLVLAGLRVAMKALEDLSYPHSKVAKVGGVSEAELARLEISFCFLAGFELIVGEEPLRQHWEALRDGKAQHMLRGVEVPTLTLEGRRRRQVSPMGGPER